MRDKMKKFIQILKIEMNEMEEDLKFLAELHKRREEQGEITEYVFRENMNIIQSEIAGLHKILESVDSLCSKTGCAEYQSFEEMLEDLDRKIRAKIKESNYADAVYELVRRKFAKVKKYIQTET